MASLLPPNATALERNLAEASKRLGEIPTPLREVMRPDSIPVEQLPWLAWHLGIDAWKTYWPEQTRRARVKSAIPIARKNGTAAAVREVVAAFGGNIALREWWQMNPRGTPGTFDLVLTLSGRDGETATAAFVADVIAEIDRTKPVRAHYNFTQGIEKVSTVGIAVACRAAVYNRLLLSDT
ncbi:phage tail protein I [Cupriavidus metallidurans]|uniref:phage tail protein I n=1 Tax=Cupriavidus metallidurans TaxID=119219 RepID=UPI001CCE4FAF|nr:phage tail protein I [Cupriavidus metallidurans]UBM11727.1 phage tail protein I [Cupriavidus metallidurans]